MTKQDLLKYAGKKTFGKNNEILTNGIVVGYDPDDNEQCLVARFENGDVSGMGWGEIYYKIKFFTKEEEEIYNSGKGCYLFAKIDNVMMEEEKELDLTKILEGCEGVELWSDLFGKCRLSRIDDVSTHPILVRVIEKCEYDTSESFDIKGRYKAEYSSGKCLLWPSETCRDWSQFKKPIKLKDDDWVVCWFEGAAFEILRYAEIKVLDYEYDYVVRFEKFNPNLSKEELKKLSIV